jgi:putative membrane protein
MLAGMNTALLVAGCVFVSLAALIHVYIFVLESLRWSRPATWRLFGLKSQADADTVRPMAFNQGFYNLFLSIGVAIGVVLIATSHTAAGLAVAVFAAGSMVAAALVLVVSSPKLARSAAIQGLAPLIGVILLGLAFLLG